MDKKELAFTPAWKQREMIVSRTISPVELVETYLERIDSFNPTLNAYLTVAGDFAIESARLAEKSVMSGDPLGPLHGIPISIKDLNATKGIRTTNGSLIYKDLVPESDDLVTERIRKSGAIILGKTNTPEFGHKGSTENRLGEPCRNPWDLSRTPGGSSGGAAAAQVSGLSSLAQGSDGGGSIRIPASFCGLYGIKPTQGRVPSIATLPGGWGQLGQSGPITSNVRDAALLLQVLSGPDKRDPSCLRADPPDFMKDLGNSIKGMRIAWTPNFGSAPVDPEVRTICEKAVRTFEHMGAVIETPDLHIDIGDAIDLLETIMWTDRTANSGHLLRDHANEMTTTFREPLEDAMKWSAQKVAFALRKLEWHRVKMTQIFDEYDLLLSPTMSVPAFVIGNPPNFIDGTKVENLVWGFNPFNFLINLSKQTAANVPCGFSQGDLPIGLQIIGNVQNEAMVLTASAAFEEAHPWIGKRPPIS